jgi:post-segregation antitoxin (ccd killing protein)
MTAPLEKPQDALAGHGAPRPPSTTCYIAPGGPQIGAPVARSVYAMRMARVNVYLPDDLAAAARDAGLNVSGITQEALTAALAQRATDRWLDDVAQLRPTSVTHAQVLGAVAAARDELEASIGG